MKQVIDTSRVVLPEHAEATTPRQHSVANRTRMKADYPHVLQQEVSDEVATTRGGKVVINKGQQGSVKLSHGLADPDMVAIKGNVFRKKIQDYHTQKAVKEAEILTLVRSDHVIELIEVVFAKKERAGALRDKVYLVTELGVPLHDHFFISGMMEERDVKQAMREIIAGLQHCHGLNVAHMDVKLDNVVNVNGVTKLIDLANAEGCKGRPELITIDCRDALGIAMDLLQIIAINREEVGAEELSLSPQAQDFCGMQYFHKRLTTEMLLKHPFLADAK